MLMQHVLTQVFSKKKLFFVSLFRLLILSPFFSLTLSVKVLTFFKGWARVREIANTYHKKRLHKETPKHLFVSFNFASSAMLCNFFGVMVQDITS